MKINEYIKKFNLTYILIYVFSIFIIDNNISLSFAKLFGSLLVHLLNQARKIQNPT